MLFRSERLRKNVEALRIDLPGGVLQATMTLGVATLAQGETAEQAIARADKALYEGKHGGRNRVVIA